MRSYVDTSVLLRAILKQPGAFPESYEGLSRGVTSEIIRLETTRALDRFRIRGLLSQALWVEKSQLVADAIAGLEEIPLEPGILRRACMPCPTPLGALDAIHLATALIWTERSGGETLTFLTHDAELAVAARAFGLVVKRAP